MKKWILSSLFAVACGTFAAPSALVANEWYNGNDCCCPCEHFDGLYVGVNAGIGSHQARRNDVDGFLTDNSGWATLETSGIGGAQIGYDWQCGCSVLGLVADWNYVGANSILLDNPNGGGGFIQSKFDWYSTLRARAGVTVCCNTLVYLTAGVAWARFDTTWDDGIAIQTTFHDKRTRLGWVGGLGMEWALSCNWSLGGELLFLQFADRDKVFTESFQGESARFRFTNNDSMYTAKVSLNYRF